MPAGSGDSAYRSIRKAKVSILAGQVWLCCAIVAAGLVVTTERAAAQSFCHYEITALIEGPPCGFGSPNPAVLDINDHGQACGRYTNCADAADRPWVWTPEHGFIALPLPAGATSGEAIGINNVLGKDGIGQVLCTNMGGLGGDSMIFDDGKWIPFESESLVAVVTGINDQTQVIGNRAITGGFLWEGGVFTDIVSEAGELTGPRALNELGAVAGSYPNGAFHWQAGVLKDLGIVIPGASSTIAVQINVKNDVGGNSNFPPPLNTIGQGWFWRNGDVVTFNALNEAPSTVVSAINDVGQVYVGTYGGSEGGVYVWQDGHAVLLSDLVDAPDNFLLVVWPVSMNTKGEIGTGFHILGESHAVGAILSPVDRPLGDVNIDCNVDERDLIVVLEDWGPDKFGHPADMVSSATFQPPGDGRVDAADLAIVLGNWSPTAASQNASRGR